MIWLLNIRRTIYERRPTLRLRTKTRIAVDVTVALSHRLVEVYRLRRDAKIIKTLVAHGGSDEMTMLGGKRIYRA